MIFRIDTAVVGYVLTTSAPPRPPAGGLRPEMGWVLIALQNAFYHLAHAGTAEEGTWSETPGMQVQHRPNGSCESQDFCGLLLSAPSISYGFARGF